MVRLTIVDGAGKTLTPKELTSASDLVSVTEQARTMIRDCERLANDLRPKNAPGTGKTPYST